MSESAAPLWWQRGVVYQVYPRSFRDASGDGTGDLAGVTEKLPYLADVLGVDALWLSPFYPSPMADFGYDVSDHTAVDPLFGTLAGFDALLAAAHARGLKVILDYVPNHTSDQHPWFQASRAARTATYRDWYVWRDPAPDGGPPNNWLAVFGGPAWEWDAPTGQYYLHSFLPEQPDLNWRNPAVQAAMFDVLRFWLERGVDGFRLDAVHYVMKDPALRDNPPANGGASDYHKPRGAYDSQRHVHDKAHPDIHRVLRDLRRLLDSYSDAGQPRVAIGEMHIYDPTVLASYYGAALDELHLPFHFGLLGVGWEAPAVRAVVDAYEAALPAGAWPNYVLGNHDEARIASRVGPARAPAAMLLLLTLRGTPTVYYGDELGLTDVPIPPERARDPWGHRVGHHLSRDPARTPMLWDGSPNAGFCPPGTDPWLPLGADAGQVNVAAQLADPHSLLALTRRLLALRRAHPALALGSYQPLDTVPADCFAYLRTAAGQRCLVAINFAAESRTLALPDLGRGQVLASTRLDREGAESLSHFTLRPNEGRVHLLSVG
jgi:alpha-glucosidase